LPILHKRAIEGIVLNPYQLTITFGVYPSTTLTQELIVPRSIL